MAYIGNSPDLIRTGRRAQYHFTATASQTVFSGTDDDGLQLDLLDDVENDVYFNGARLILDDDYTISGNTLTLTAPAAAGDILVIVTQDDVQNFNSYTKAEADSRYINYDGDIVNGDIQVVGEVDAAAFITTADGSSSACSVQLNDVNTGLFGSGGSGYINFAANGTHAWTMGNNFLQYQPLGGGPSLRGETASSTNPTILPYRDDSNTGLGANGSDEVYLITGGTARLTANSSGIDVTGTVTADGLTVDGSVRFDTGSGENFYMYRSASADLTLGLGSSNAVIKSIGPIAIMPEGTSVQKYNFTSSVFNVNGPSVGIGTSTPAQKLTVYDGILLLEQSTASNNLIRFTENGSESFHLGVDANADFHIAGPSFSNNKYATVDSSGNVGIGTASPTEKLEVAGNVKASDYILEAIDASIADTATDIFIYDTSKDSDGGAWRKRTQHTSWYNETLNTATRGSRKEFPAVAVIVAESSQVTIYDGDDPDMPMWMVFQINPYATGNNIAGTPYGIGFNSNGGGLNAHNVSSVYMMNGQLFIGGDTGVHAGWSANFINEVMYEYLLYPTNATNTARWTLAGNISQRNEGEASTTAPSTRYSASGNSFGIKSVANDVAMTVLPNAPIDSATGLPVPTIAVATDGGVSVIKDDGTVVDIVETSGPNSVHKVNFRGNKLGFYTSGTSGIGGFPQLYYTDIPSSDVSASYFYGNITSSGWEMYGGFWESAGTNKLIFNAGTGSTLSDVVDGAASNERGLNLISPVPTDAGKGMVNYITKDYQTGWMNGDIKLATLSDTDDTDAGGNLVTNGTFDSDTGWTHGSSMTISGGTLNFALTGAASATQTISFTPGDQYVVTFDMSNYSSGAFYPHIGGVQQGSFSSNGSHSIFITAGGSNGLIELYGASGSNYSIDNVVVTKAAQDRSVNGNGLQVFGTVTKNPVATGADLVAYSGWSSSNYLVHPYNSGIATAIDNNEVCINFWFKETSGDGNNRILVWGCNDNLTINFGVYHKNSNLLSFYIDDGTASYDQVQSSAITADGVWRMCTAVRSGNTAQLYVNGSLVGTTTCVNAVDFDLANNTDFKYYLGYRAPDNGLTYTGGHLALVRISATAPSAEQIAKIYEDEKVLFQENAQATLYGSSDAVTALAYDDDTELLHVGTSAGRSVFQGLRRVDNTTDAVGVAISASNGMVAED